MTKKKSPIQKKISGLKKKMSSMSRQTQAIAVVLVLVGASVAYLGSGTDLLKGYIFNPEITRTKEITRGSLELDIPGRIDPSDLIDRDSLLNTTISAPDAIRWDKYPPMNDDNLVNIIKIMPVLPLEVEWGYVGTGEPPIATTASLPDIRVSTRIPSRADIRSMEFIIARAPFDILDSESRSNMDNWIVRRKFTSVGSPTIVRQIPPDENAGSRFLSYQTTFKSTFNNCGAYQFVPDGEGNTNIDLTGSYSPCGIGNYVIGTIITDQDGVKHYGEHRYRVTADDPVDPPADDPVDPPDDDPVDPPDDDPVDPPDDSPIADMERVQGLHVSGVGDEMVRLTWTEVEGADGYYVYFNETSLPNRTEDLGSSVPRATSPGTSYTVEGLHNFTRYYFRVAAYRGAHTSRKLSSEEYATPRPPAESTPEEQMCTFLQTRVLDLSRKNHVENTLTSLLNDYEGNNHEFADNAVTRPWVDQLITFHGQMTTIGGTNVPTLPVFSYVATTPEAAYQYFKLDFRSAYNEWVALFNETIDYANTHVGCNLSDLSVRDVSDPDPEPDPISCDFSYDSEGGLIFDPNNHEDLVFSYSATHESLTQANDVSIHMTGPYYIVPTEYDDGDELSYDVDLFNRAENFPISNSYSWDGTLSGDDPIEDGAYLAELEIEVDSGESCRKQAVVSVIHGDAEADAPVIGLSVDKTDFEIGIETLMSTLTVSQPSKRTVVNLYEFGSSSPIATVYYKCASGEGCPQDLGWQAAGSVEFLVSEHIPHDGLYYLKVSVKTADDRVYKVASEVFEAHDGTFVPACSFTDVPTSDVDYDAIMRVCELGIMTGSTDGFGNRNFKPSNSTKRIEGVAIANRLALCPAQPYTWQYDFNLGFWDLDSYLQTPSAWWMGENIKAGLGCLNLSGYKDGSFKPANSMNFAEGWKVALEAVQSAGINNFAPFYINRYASPWWSDYMYFLDQNNIKNQYDNGGKGTLLRRDMAKLIFDLEDKGLITPVSLY